jgi:hypothetical protein
MKLGMAISPAQGVLGAEGGAWTGWTADTGGGAPGLPVEAPEQDQWAGGPNRVSWTPDYSKPGRHAGYDSNILVGTPPGRAIAFDETGRVRREPMWPQGGMVSRPVVDRNYDVQQFTGYSVSTVRAGQWARGARAGFVTPTWHPAKPPIMYDPTDPDTWDAVRTFN